MKIDLPLETWTDVFSFLPRVHLAQLVPHIGDRQFVTFINFSLHECGEVTLGRLRIKSPLNGNDGPAIVQTFRELPLGDVPMPDNIKNFTEIRLSHFDASVLSFLKEFQRNSLLSNVNLNLAYVNSANDLNALPPPKFMHLMANVVPLLTNINLINIVGNNVLLDLMEKGNSELTFRMLTSARVLHACYKLSPKCLYNWMYTPREDGEPRVLVLHPYRPADGRNVNSFRPDDDQTEIMHHIESLIKNVRKEFLSANRAVSFFVHFHYRNVPVDIFETISLDNIRTNERLVIAGIESNYLLISRHPIGANPNGEWIKEKRKDAEWKHRNITIDI